MMYARWGPEEEASGFMENVVLPAFKGGLLYSSRPRFEGTHDLFFYLKERWQVIPRTVSYYVAATI